MNEEITIEQQLQTELSRLKKAIDYIEKAENSVKNVQTLNEETQIKCHEILKSNDSLKRLVNEDISSTHKKIEQIIDNISHLANKIENCTRSLGYYKSLTDSNLEKYSSNCSSEIASVKRGIKTYNEKYTNNFNSISNRLLNLESKVRECDRKFIELENAFVEINSKMNLFQVSLLKISRRKWWNPFR